MTCAAPEGDAPAALQLPANFAQASQETLLRMAIFHGSGVNSRSCPFQQSRNLLDERTQGREIMPQGNKSIGKKVVYPA